MSRFASALFALALLIALVVAVDPNARRKAEESVQNFGSAWRSSDDTVVVNVPSVDIEATKPASTPAPTVTPSTTTADQDNDFDEDSSDEPIIIVNWDALGDSLRNFWESLKQIKIDINPRDNN
jgi:hypothetical protein